MGVGMKTLEHLAGGGGGGEGQLLWLLVCLPAHIMSLLERGLCALLFACIHTSCPFWKEVFSRRKEFAPSGSKFLSFREESLSEESQNILKALPPLIVHQLLLNIPLPHVQANDHIQSTRYFEVEGTLRNTSRYPYLDQTFAELRTK